MRCGINLLLSSFKVNGPTVDAPSGTAGRPDAAICGRCARQNRAAVALGAVRRDRDAARDQPLSHAVVVLFRLLSRQRDATLLAGRRRLAAITFVVGLIGLEMAGTNSEFYAVGIVIPSAIAAALMIGAVAASRELLQWTTRCAVAVPRIISYSLLFGALADLLPSAPCSLIFAARSCRPISGNRR